MVAWKENLPLNNVASFNLDNGRAILTAGYDVSPVSLARAVQRFFEVLGHEAVLTDETSVLEFHDPFQGNAATQFQPSFVVQPASFEEVQAALQIATELRVPMWT